MEKIRLAFSDFWPTFDPSDNFFTQVLNKEYEIEVVKLVDNPDLLIYSYFGHQHLLFSGLKIYFTGENDVPDFNFCDYAISFHDISFGDRHLRLPLYVIYPSFDRLRKEHLSGKDHSPNNSKDFCSMVVSNNVNCNSARIDFFTQLSKYKVVASGGGYLNNVGGRVADKLKFLNRYKFNIAFENSKVSGYTTEKIIDAFAAGCIPIYWGNDLVAREINPSTYIDLKNFATREDAIKYILSVDSNSDLYNSFFMEHPLKNNHFLNWEDQLLDFLSRAINSRKRYVVDEGAMGSIKALRAVKEELYSYPKLRKALPFIRKTSSVFKVVRSFFSHSKEC